MKISVIMILPIIQKMPATSPIIGRTVERSEVAPSARSLAASCKRIRLIMIINVPTMKLIASLMKLVWTIRKTPAIISAMPVIIVVNFCNSFGVRP